MARFFRYQLRTTDVDGARAFYAAVLDHLPHVPDSPIFQLHERAIANGAKPHWLGSIDVGDGVARMTEALVAKGGSVQGPSYVDPHGVTVQMVRDPGGALFAFASGSKSEQPAMPASWHYLNTTEVERSKAIFADLCGWDFREPFTLEEHGTLHPFAYELGGPLVGSIVDITGRPGRHPHWLYELRVAALESALAAVRDRRGVIVGPFDLPNGDRLAVCDDAQGAAFALREVRTPAR